MGRVGNVGMGSVREGRRGDGISVDCGVIERERCGNWPGRTHSLTTDPS